MVEKLINLIHNVLCEYEDKVSKYGNSLQLHFETVFNTRICKGFGFYFLIHIHYNCVTFAKICYFQNNFNHD